jgi:hypothetical protein
LRIIKLLGKVLFLWTLETVLSTVAFSVSAYFDEYNSASVWELFEDAIKLLAGVRLVFFLVPYLLLYCLDKELLDSSTVVKQALTHTFLFIILALVATVIFPWHVFIVNALALVLMPASAFVSVLITNLVFKKPVSQLHKS